MTLMALRRGLVGLALLLVWGLSPSAAADGPAPLVVGVKEAPPFVIRSADGGFDGISIRLWQAVAAELERDYELRETDLPGLLAGLEDGSLDVAVAALTVTPERETRFDFSHPFHSSGFGIAVPHHPAGLAGALRGVFSWQLVQALGALLLVLLAVGVVMWAVERRANPGHFGGPPHHGIGSGLWWSAVTMTTVGYGDKAPLTAAGRTVAMVWMFASVITVSGFTAAIASAFTVQQLGSRIQGPQDLPGLAVATVRGSTSDQYLQEHRARPRYYADPEAALLAVAAGEVDAAVYDEPILRYLAAGPLAGRVDVLPETFVRQDYALGLPADSPLREPVNRALLRHVAEPAWRDTLYRYLGL